MTWLYTPKTNWRTGIPGPLTDAGNQRALANLLAGAGWNGRARPWLDAQSIRARLHAVVQGTWYVVQGPSLAAVDAYDPTLGGAVPDGIDVDTWNLYAGVGVATPYRTPVARRVGQLAYKLAVLQGVGPGNVALAETNLDPRGVSENMMPATRSVANFGGGPDFVNIPPGAKAIRVSADGPAIPLAGELRVSVFRIGGGLLSGPTVILCNAAATGEARSAVLDIPSVTPPFDLMLLQNNDPGVNAAVIWRPLP